MANLILVINPGSVTTKLALFKDEVAWVIENLDHTNTSWILTHKTIAQFPFRAQAVREFLKRNGVSISQLSAVVARGGLLRPLDSGTYLVNDRMLDDLKKEVGGVHASNLGGLLARDIADEAHVPAFIVDPVSVDEFSELARVSGLPGLPRKSLLHALNMKAAALKSSRELGRPLEELFLVIAHLGSGFSISPCYRGKLRDVNNSNEEGPFTVERAGTLPCLYIKERYESEKDAKRLKETLVNESGMFGYLGTKDAKIVETSLPQAKSSQRVFRAMAFQVAKEIGAMAASYPENPDAVVLTGGLAKSRVFVNMVKEYSGFVGRYLVYPGEDEMECLAQGALRVLKGIEEAKEYAPSNQRKLEVVNG